jgi:hypothetical protein
LKVRTCRPTGLHLENEKFAGPGRAGGGQAVS